MKRASALFRVLADPTRLRLLRVLAADRFNVSELTAILALAQSGVSRHLALLREAGLVVEERANGFTYYHLADATGPDASPVWRLLQTEFDAAAGDAAVRRDAARIQEVLRQRDEQFDTVGDPRQLVPGRSWAAWARALGHLLPALEVADVGCGEGDLTIEIARWAGRVTGIDRSDDVLERAQALAARHAVSNVVWKKGDLARLPLRDESVDLAIYAQSLRYAADPERALDEAVRVVRPGGRVLVLDLEEHDQAWVRTRFGDQRLGFPDAALSALLTDAGLRHVHLDRGAARKGNPFTVIIASAVRSARPRPRTAPERPGRRW
jgi:ArsR family transcriptional regulator